MVTKKCHFKVPNQSEIENAKIDGYADGFEGKDMTSFKYIGKDTLFSAYICAKSQGGTERVKLKNKEISMRFKENNYE